jgi:glycosyltransferase involved in cell wall biosynthesis
MTRGPLSGEDIVCLALRRWNTPWKNNQQVMSLVARSNRVLYVGPPRAFRESFAALRMGLGNPTLERYAERLFVYSEPWFLSPIRRTRRGAGLLNRITQVARATQVHTICRQLKFQTPILWVYDPMLAPAVGSFCEKLVIYHVIDNYDEYFPQEATRLRSLVVKNQRIMLERADVVFAVSEALHRRCLELNPNSHLVPNGVNYPLFEKAMSSDRLPTDVASIPRPIIGYVGVIQPRIDFRFLGQMADARPDWSFMLVGPTEYLDGGEGFSNLVQRQNVYYLGPKPVEQIPFYVKACDVGILPYKQDGFFLYIDSLKLYEYLACGRPVVSSDMPCSRRFVPLVRIARDLSEFIDGIEMSLAEDGTTSAERIALARQHSWDRRVEAMGEIVGATLAGERHTEPVQELLAR